MILQAILCFRALLSLLSAGCGGVRVTKIESIADMLLSHDLQLFLYVPVQHFQMVTGKGTSDIFTGIQSGDPSLPCQLPQLLISQIPVAVINTSAV